MDKENKDEIRHKLTAFMANAMTDIVFEKLPPPTSQANIEFIQNISVHRFNNDPMFRRKVESAVATVMRLFDDEPKIIAPRMDS